MVMMAARFSAVNAMALLMLVVEPCAAWLPHTPPLVHGDAGGTCSASLSHALASSTNRMPNLQLSLPSRAGDLEMCENTGNVESIANALSRHFIGVTNFKGSRRQVFASAALLFAAAVPVVAQAADTPPEKTNVWLSGRSDPIRKTSKDKPDGTKRDSKYLSCLNDCVPRCQGPPGANQKERADCFEQCQDECCFTYQQCTYKIRQ